MTKRHPTLRTRRLWIALALLLGAGATACRRSGVRRPTAAEIVEGRVDSTFVVDTTADSTTVGITRARWALRPPGDGAASFWENIAGLDITNAEKTARSVDERTFVLALQLLLASDPDAATVAFRALHGTARDAVARSRARVGLTMALSWYSDWPSLATMSGLPDAADTDTSAVRKSIECWAKVLADLPPPTLELPDVPVTLPLRISAFGTPVVTVHVNGHPYEFWLDTGASMTLLSARVARAAGAMLVAVDTLALGVVGGQIPARALFIDSLALGAVRARGLGAALVAPDALRLDQRLVNGVRQFVPIDGVIGMDLLRHLDLVLDADAGTITIRRPVRNSRAVRNLYWVGYPVVRLVASDGRPLLFGLDTGADFSYVTNSLLRKLPRTPVAMRRSTVGGLGPQKLTTAWVARSLTLSDGDYAITMANVPVMPELQWTFVTFDGVLGSDVVLRARLHLDFVNGVFDARRSARAGQGPP